MRSSGAASPWIKPAQRRRARRRRFPRVPLPCCERLVLDCFARLYMIGYMFADLFADVPEADWPALRNVTVLSWFNSRAGRSFKAQLIERRRALGLSQAQVAERMGVEPPVVYELEQYDSDPPLSMLQRYATAVGARVEWRVF